MQTQKLIAFSLDTSAGTTHWGEPLATTNDDLEGGCGDSGPGSIPAPPFMFGLDPQRFIINFIFFGKTKVQTFHRMN